MEMSQSSPDSGDVVLCTQSGPSQERLGSPQKRQGAGEEEEAAGVSDLKSASRDQRSSLKRAEHDGIAVERDAGHHKASSGIPGIVFKQVQHPLRGHTVENQPNGGGTIIQRNVVEDAIDVAKVILTVILRKLINAEVADGFASVAGGGHFESIY